MKVKRIQLNSIYFDSTYEEWLIFYFYEIVYFLPLIYHIYIETYLNIFLVNIYKKKHNQLWPMAT